MALPHTTDASGRILITQGPALHTGFIQRLSGSPIDAATSKTLSTIATQASASRAMGVGQKGARRSVSRRRRSRSRFGTRRRSQMHLRRRSRQGGAVNLHANIPQIPEAGTISGVSVSQNHLNNVNTLNQIRADKVYDSLINSPAIQRAGRREQMCGSGNGRSRKRTHRRKHRKSASTRRRKHRRV
jgi:hypothetical protein